MDLIWSDNNYTFLCLTVLGITFVVWLFNFVKGKDSTKQQLNLSGDSRTQSTADVVIVGSGILGSALAAVLARDGRRVTVIERDLKEPNRIVGELLQPGGCRALKLLNLEGCIEGLDSQRVLGYVLHDICKRVRVDIPYNDDHECIEIGRAFHHGRFVMALRRAAMAEQNVNYIEGTVNNLIEESGNVVGVSYKSKTSEASQMLFAPLTVVADGCFSRLRKHLVKLAPETKSQFVGLLLENCPQTKADHAELVLANPSPILVYRISPTHTRMLIDVRGDLPKDMREYLKREIYSQLPESLRESFVNAVENGQIRSMPNSFLPCAPIFKGGVMCLGDAVNMRHPLTGGGMSVALYDVVTCRQLLKDIPNLNDYDAVLKATELLYIRRKKNHSFVVNVLSMGLYELFASTDENGRCLKDACFQYFQRGGECVAGPVALLSILKPKPYLLLGHFFAVALFAVYLAFKKEPFWAFHRSFYAAICITFRACTILFPLVWSEIKY